jgi:hypothetical protein
MGVYDTKIRLKEINYNNKTIIFFPMHHIGRDDFYINVRKKLDSISKMDYVFYFEKIELDNNDSLTNYKLRKVLNFGLPKNGYKNLLDSIISTKKINLKHKLTNQPAYNEWDLKGNFYIVDLNAKQIVSNVEKEKKIVLDDCDFINDYDQPYKCKNKFLSKEEFDNFIIDDRNQHLANEVIKSPHKKIAIIYGKAHLKGFEEILNQNK